jgi:hypothetical protein
MSISVVILSSCLFSLSFAYLVLFYNFSKVRTQYQKLFIDMMILEKLVDEVEESKIKLDDSVHKENFIKFISDSRDWAYQYIEDVQLGINNFISEVEPEVNYFKEYGAVGAMMPNYHSMKKIVEEYEKLKKFLPKEDSL